MRGKNFIVVISSHMFHAIDNIQMKCQIDLTFLFVAQKLHSPLQNA